MDNLGFLFLVSGFLFFLGLLELLENTNQKPETRNKKPNPQTLGIA